MPGEQRRNLRSSKETSSSTNGEKPRPESQNSSKTDNPVPTRSTSSKGKATISKKGLTNQLSKETGTDKPQTNGSEPAENGINGNEDVEMVDDIIEKSKAGDDEMTVVVPPPKSSKLAGEPDKAEEMDIALDRTPEMELDQTEESADPKARAVSGESIRNRTDALAISVVTGHLISIL